MIIGLTGRAFSGKDTVGAYLSRAHNFSLVAFADPIRDALMAAFALNPNVFRPEYKELEIDGIGKSPRQLMQLFGTEFGRQMIKPTIWTDMMERRIRHSVKAGDCDIVITDVRFWTEAALFSRAGLAAVVYGPGDIAQAHTVDEWVALDQLQHYTDSILRMLATP